MEEIIQVITSLFECVKKENNNMISDMKDLMEKTNDIFSDLKDDISTLEKKVDSLSVDIYDTDQYKHGEGLVISRDIILHGTPTENCKDIVLHFF